MRRERAATWHNEWLAVGGILAVSLILNLTALTWGLPNGDTTWAPDGLTPTEPLVVAHRLVLGGWNSGWFDWKYPPGHTLLLAGFYSPYLAWLWLSGGLGALQTHYPYGFADPEHTFWVLAMIGRTVSALMISLATVLWYATCRELWSRRVAFLAACFFTTIYPLVYYAHTTNVDGPLVFWMIVAIYGATRVFSRGNDRLGAVLFGGAFAMALSTKESAFGALAILPPIVLVEHLRRRQSSGAGGLFPTGALPAATIAVIVFILMNAIPLNPAGVLHRVQFLTHTISEPVRRLYAPHYHPVGSAGLRSLNTEASHAMQVVNVMDSSMGWPLLAAAGVGVVCWGWRRRGLIFTLPAVVFWLLSVRTLQTVRPRFVMPLCVFATVFAALTLDALVRLVRGKSSRVLVEVGVAACVLFSIVRGAEAVRVLLTDPRYAAETWLRANLPKGATVEIYQRLTYLPRMPATARVTRVAFDDITIADFRRRRPDFVVLSLAGITGITSKYREDWRQDTGDLSDDRVVWGRGIDGQALTFEYKSNRAFLDALQQECLGWARVATFESSTWLPPRIIKGIAPTIYIYSHRDGGPERPDTPECIRLLRTDDAERQLSVSSSASEPNS
jgi:4-amino-4-deoxy-L-arabinose transferase-like glycosyltransferase